MTLSFSTTNSSSKPTFLKFSSLPKSISSRNLAFPVSKIDLDVGSKNL